MLPIVQTNSGFLRKCYIRAAEGWVCYEMPCDKWNSKPNIAALGFILFTDSDIEYVASIPFKRIERCVGDIKAIPALWRLTKTLFKLNVDCIDETPAI
jgi:hypothetical protein